VTDHIVVYKLATPLGFCKASDLDYQHTQNRQTIEMVKDTEHTTTRTDASDVHRFTNLDPETRDDSNDPYTFQVRPFLILSLHLSLSSLNK
jgi:hypothetical protein